MTDDSPGDLSLEDYLDRMVAGTLTPKARAELAAMARALAVAAAGIIEHCVAREPSEVQAVVALERALAGAGIAMEDGR